MSILSRRVLILNKDWTAIGTCSVRRAIKLISNFDDKGTPKATAIDENIYEYVWEEWLELEPGEFFVSSVSKKVKAPSVILCRTKALPRLYSGFTRTGAFLRDNYTCQYCDKKINKKDITIDHVIPRCKGGKDNWFNCVSCCTNCNNFKGDRTPEEANMELAKEPSRPPLIMCEEPMPELWKKFIK